MKDHDDLLIVKDHDNRKGNKADMLFDAIALFNAVGIIALMCLLASGFFK